MSSVSICKGIDLNNRERIDKKKQTNDDLRPTSIWYVAEVLIGENRCLKQFRKCLCECRICLYYSTAKYSCEWRNTPKMVMTLS